jgi:hypothetical protein
MSREFWYLAALAFATGAVFMAALRLMASLPRHLI